MNNELKAFNSYKELKKNTNKTSHSSVMTMESKHYVFERNSFKGNRFEPNGHGCRKCLRDDYNAAWEQRAKNFEKYIARYNELHSSEFMNEQDLRETSIWLDSNHSELNGYHDYDTSTTYQPLRMPDERPKLYYGLELEITVEGLYDGDRYDANGWRDDYGEYDEEGNYIEDERIEDIAYKTVQLLGGLAVASRDGSLAYGKSFELVFRPMSKRVLHSDFVKDRIKSAFDYLKEQGALVEQPKENGLHIHISQRFFEGGNRSTDEIQRDLGWAFQRYQTEIEAIGGRKYNRWCRSAVMNAKQNLAGSYGIVIEKAHLSKNQYCIGRYDHSQAFIVSDSGYTYEARVFHSTLDLNRILACVELMSNLSNGARDNALEGKTFGQIIRYTDSPCLARLVKQIKAEKKEKLSLGKRNINTLSFTTAD